MVQNAQGPGSPPEWTQLPDVLARFTAVGIDAAQAKQSLCHAIAQRRIKVRCRVADILLSGDEVEIPTDLASDDLDWPQSRPVKPWRCAKDGRGTVESIELLTPAISETVKYFESASVCVPPHLTRASFDWTKSRPLTPWPVRPRAARRDDWRSFSHPALLI